MVRGGTGAQGGSCEGERDGLVVSPAGLEEVGLRPRTETGSREGDPGRQVFEPLSG